MFLIERWRNLSTREHITLLSGGIVLFLLLGFHLLWKPLVQNHHQLEEQIAQQQKNLVWMQQAAVKIASLKAGTSLQSGTPKRSLLAHVDQTVRQSGLAQAVRRIEPEGEKTVKVWLENAPFDSFILWVGQLEQARIHMIKLNLNRQEEVGLASIKATFGY